MHLSITVASLSLFECLNVEGNDWRMRLHMDYKCYSSEHLAWIAAVSLPSIIIWVISCPLAAFIILYKNRENLDEGPAKQYLFALYQGLVDKCYYWEFVNTIRKTLLLVLVTALPVVNLSYRILCSIVILVTIIYLQKGLRPYRKEENNSIDNKALIAGIMVLYASVLFEDDSYGEYRGFTFLAMILLAAINSIFILEWIYLMLVSCKFKNENLRAFLKLFG